MVTTWRHRKRAEIERRWRRSLGVLVGICLVGAVLPATAVAVTCTAEVDRHRVAPGDQVLLTITVDGAFQSAPPVNLPRLEGVEILTGGTSQSFSFINGQVKATVTSTYYLIVRRNSSFTIPELTIEIEGRQYQTQPIPIEVDRTAQRPAPSGPPPGGTSPPPVTSAPDRPSGTSSTPGGRPGDEIFITLATDKSQAYVGEQVVLTFRFHRRIQLWENPQYSAPRAEGFWREDLPPERTYLQVIAGHRYHITEIRYALFPTRPGRLTIEPAKVTIPSDMLDRFFSFNRRRSRGPRQLETEPLAVEVSGLPAPRPEGYSGIVANQLTLTTAVDRDSVPRGEPVTLEVELKADGFLKGMAALPLTAPDQVKMHDSVENLTVDKSGERLVSHYRVEKVLVPTVEGRLRLEPIRIVYFNPRQSRYETVTRAGATLFVTPSDRPVAGDELGVFARSGIERLAKDLAFVHTPPGRLRTRWRPLVAMPVWWGLAVTPLVLLGVLRWMLARAAREQRDPLGRRRRRALAQARRQLRAARRAPDRAEALSLLAQAIAGYVADRCGRASAGLTAAEVSDYAGRLDLSETGRRLAALLTRCDAERYGGDPATDVTSAASREVRDLVGEAERCLQSLEKAAAGRRVPAATRLRIGAWLLALFLTAPSGLLAQEEFPPAGPPAGGPDPVRLVAEGNQAYTSGDVETALARYREVLTRGVNDPVVHYNLGNAFARRGELGRAILSYQRAARLSPRDRDIRANLAWVRSYTRDLELAPGHLPPGVRQLVATVRYLSLDEWSRVLLVLLWLVAGLLAWAWYRGAFSDALRRLALVGGGLLIAVVVIVVVLWYHQEVRAQAVVVVPEVEVHSGPAATFPVVFRVHDGLTLTIRGEREGWLRIGLGGEWVGWVPAGTVARVGLKHERPTLPG
jgi:cytochrome c-type biogenesis protein CcmH/NrfG